MVENELITTHEYSGRVINAVTYVFMTTGIWFDVAVATIASAVLISTSRQTGDTNQQSEEWRKLNSVDLDDIYDPFPDDEYYKNVWVNDDMRSFFRVCFL